MLLQYLYNRVNDLVSVRPNLGTGFIDGPKAAAPKSAANCCCLQCRRQQCVAVAGVAAHKSIGDPAQQRKSNCAENLWKF